MLGRLLWARVDSDSFAKWMWLIQVSLKNRLGPGRRFKCISHETIEVTSIPLRPASETQHLTALLLYFCKCPGRGNILSFYQHFTPYCELIFSTLMTASWNNGKHSKIQEVIKTQMLPNRQCESSEAESQVCAHFDNCQVDTCLAV